MYAVHPAFQLLSFQIFFLTSLLFIVAVDFYFRYCLSVTLSLSLSLSLSLLSLSLSLSLSLFFVFFVFVWSFFFFFFFYSELEGWREGRGMSKIIGEWEW